jgi:coproporphyrinogen III oxidase-like Fe-S oxidoreductase
VAKEVINLAKEKLKKIIEDDRYVEKFFLQEIELKEVDVIEIAEKVGKRKKYEGYSEVLLKILDKILLKKESNYNNLKEEIRSLSEKIKRTFIYYMSCYDAKIIKIMRTDVILMIFNTNNRCLSFYLEV